MGIVKGFHFFMHMCTQRKWEVPQCSICTEYGILKVFQYGEAGRGLRHCGAGRDRHEYLYC